MNGLWIIAIIFLKTEEIFAMNIFESSIESTSSEISNAYVSESPVVVNTVNSTRHAFFRAMDKGMDLSGSPARRVFGGAAAELKEFPLVCALLDRYYTVRCSATVLTPFWVLTAAHCVSPRLAYVKYNTRRPASGEGNITAVQYLYQHPRYQVVQKDEGRGIDVVSLHHDVGLVRARDPIKLVSASGFGLDFIRKSNPLDLLNKDVKVFGFGRTERSVLGEELFAVELRLSGCERVDWLHCVCGIARTGTPQGVCSGDSGGPVLYGGHPIGVTSMGPVECAHSLDPPPPSATSVFTSLQPYSDMINATILDTEAALRMRMISGASLQFSRLACLAFCLMIVG